LRRDRGDGPFSQGDEAQELKTFSHIKPSTFTGQVQVKPLTEKEQEPPLAQGEELHAS